MLMATSYPFLEIFWTMLIFFTWVIWIFIVVTVLVDVFGRAELSGWAKAGWTVFVKSCCPSWACSPIWSSTAAGWPNGVPCRPASCDWCDELSRS